jgi:hypothetical protein
MSSETETDYGHSRLKAFILERDIRRIGRGQYQGNLSPDLLPNRNRKGEQWWRSGHIICEFFRSKHSEGFDWNSVPSYQNLGNHGPFQSALIKCLKEIQEARATA